MADDTPAGKKGRGPIRYRKTQHRFLEDLVLLLRVAGDMKLDPDQPPGGKAKQIYTAAELARWQRRHLNRDLPKRFDYLEPSHLQTLFPDTDGQLSDDVMLRIMGFQAADHQRIFRVRRGDGVWRYGAYQGLHEEMAYTELAPCPPELTLAVHLTAPKTAQALLDGVPIEHNKTRRRRRFAPDFQPPVGHIAPIGRYILAFAWFDWNDAGGLTMIDEKWPMRARLFKRFRSRVGIAVDMPILRAHYAARGVPWAEVCGVNPIHTVVILRPVPPEALIARGRSGDPPTGGTPFPLTELWGMTDPASRP